MADAVDIVISKQDDHGIWKAENTYNSVRLLIRFNAEDGHSKWITLRAMRVLKRYNRRRIA